MGCRGNQTLGYSISGYGCCWGLGFPLMLYNCRSLARWFQDYLQCLVNILFLILSCSSIVMHAQRMWRYSLFTFYAYAKFLYSRSFPSAVFSIFLIGVVFVAPKMRFRVLCFASCQAWFCWFWRSYRGILCLETSNDAATPLYHDGGGAYRVW